MTLRQRVTAITTVGLIVLVILGGWLTYRFVRTADASAAIVTSLQPAADASRTLSTAYSDAEGFVSVAIIDTALSITSTTASSPCSDARACYQASMATAGESRAAILAALPGDEEVAAAVRVSEATAEYWQGVDANSVFLLLDLGRNELAARVSRSAHSRDSYEAMTASAIALQRLVDDRRSQQIDDYASLSRKLAWAIAIAGLVLLGLMLVALGLLHRWVLTPLDELRAQLRSASTTEGRYAPITPSGPPELSATGVDAESMRRQLVAQIDEATSAREGLRQQGPVVAAIRAELEASEHQHVAGLVVAGSLQPAEGVLAGDWWDFMSLPDGRAALLVTDVAGHGPEAGIGAVRVKNVIGGALVSGSHPDVALEQAAIAFRDEEGRFATCAVILIEPATGALTWANAGHPPPLLRRAHGEALRLAATGPLVSGLGGQWTRQTESLHIGDVLFVWSDGLVESHDAEGVELGDAGLNRLIDAAMQEGSTPSEIVAHVLAAARARAVDWRRDDVTLAAVARD